MDEEYRKIKTSITQNPPEVSEKEQGLAKARILLFFSLCKKTNLRELSLPELIKYLAIMPASQRFISSLVYPKKHNSHGDQYSGRELKRWAAIQLDELFEDSAIMKNHRFENFNGEYWHE